MTKHLALFDFDGTLTRKDTLVELIKFTAGSARYYLGLLWLSPTLIAFALRWIPNWRAKEFLFGHFFRGMTEQDFLQTGKKFAETVVPQLIRPSALAAMQRHIASGARVVIVTASSAAWIKPWSDALGIELIATQWEVVAGKLTGKIQGRNCHGEEKKRRVLEKLNLADYTDISVYGDTSGDHAMLTLGTKQYYRHFTD